MFGRRLGWCHRCSGAKRVRRGGAGTGGLRFRTRMGRQVGRANENGGVFVSNYRSVDLGTNDQQRRVSQLDLIARLQHGCCDLLAIDE